MLQAKPPPRPHEGETQRPVFHLFVYFWLHWVFVAVHGLSLLVESGHYSLVALRGLLIEVASLVAEHGLCGVWASVVAGCGLLTTGSVVVLHGLSCPVAQRIFLDQGSNWYPLCGKAES